jgi:tRNA(fMet)-specific endonuclease VapC
MILLDTDHVTLLKYPNNERGARLAQRLDAVPSDEEVGVAIITVEEQMRGWLATIAKERTARRQVAPYRELAELFDFFAEFTIAHFDDAAADQFDSLRAAKIRLGSMDLKIAAIALVNQTLLLSANRRDFEQVPGLRVENWLD